MFLNAKYQWLVNYRHVIKTLTTERVFLLRKLSSLTTDETLAVAVPVSETVTVGTSAPLQAGAALSSWQPHLSHPILRGDFPGQSLGCLVPQNSLFTAQ